MRTECIVAARQAIEDHLPASSVPVSSEPQIRKTLGALFLVTGESWTGAATEIDNGIKCTLLFCSGVTVCFLWLFSPTRTLIPLYYDL